MMALIPIPTGRSPITDLCAIADRAMADTAQTGQYRCEPYRKHREAWVLGRFSSIYNATPSVSQTLWLAEPGDPPSSIPADFAVFDQVGAYVADVEITELTDVWEWYRPGIKIEELRDPWAHLPGLLQKKVGTARKYRNPTWLIVYDNASSAIYWEMDGVAFGVADAGRSIANLVSSQSSITAIWILSSDGRRIERAYPSTFSAQSARGTLSP